MEKKNSQMRILVLAGTGAMGEWLVDILASRGDSVTVTSRKKRDDKPGVEYVQMDAKDINVLSNLLKQGWDAVVDFLIYSTEDFKARLDDLLSYTNQYVFISSSRVYAKSDGPITEESPRLLDDIGDEEYLKTDEYALAKARSENALRESGHSNWTIIRPYITYSVNRLQLGTMEKEAWLGRALRGNKILFSRDVAAKTTTMTFGRDVARGISSLLGKDAALGRAFHITTPESHKWSEILDIYLDVIEEETGKRPEVAYVDSSLEWEKVFGGHYQLKCDRLYDRTFDSSAVAEVGGFSSYTPVREGISECLRAYIKSGSRTRANTMDALRDRLSGDKTSLREFAGPKRKLAYLAIRYIIPLPLVRRLLG